MDARDEILTALEDGPLAALELASDLGYDPIQIGLDESGSGYWTHGAHAPALTDLVKNGIVRVRVADDLSIEYGLAEHLRADESGDRSPIITQVKAFLDAVCVGLDNIQRPFWNVAQRDGLSLSYNGIVVELSVWDYITDCGHQAPMKTWPWPVDGNEESIRASFAAALLLRKVDVVSGEDELKQIMN